MPVAIDLKFFVLLGMVAMTGAVLNAAMTALVATPELSQYSSDYQNQHTQLLLHVRFVMRATPVSSEAQ
jgi:hypothetical protein